MRSRRPGERVGDRVRQDRAPPSAQLRDPALTKRVQRRIYRRHGNAANSGNPRKFAAIRRVFAIDRIEQCKVFGGGKEVPVGLVPLVKDPLEEVTALELSQGLAFPEGFCEARARGNCRR